MLILYSFTLANWSKILISDFEFVTGFGACSTGCCFDSTFFCCKLSMFVREQVAEQVEPEGNSGHGTLGWES